MEKDVSTIDKFIEPSQWMIWKFQVRVNLMAAELVGYIDGSTERPTDATETNHQQNLADWKKNDAKAQKLMVNSCGSKVLIHLCNCSTAKEMWDKLHSVYEHTSAAAKQLLQEKYHSYKKNPSHDIATHISTLQSMVQNLKAVGVSIDDSGLIMKILMTLPSEYRHFLSAWDSVAENDKTVKNLTDRLMVEESRYGFGNLNLNEVDESEALLAKHGGSSSHKRHQRNQKNSAMKQKGKCYKCGSSEHYKRDCPDISSSNDSIASSHGDEKGFIGSAIQSLSKDDAWYQDSGATSHMSKQRNWFVNYVELEEPIDILIGNGDVMRAIGRGDIDALVYDGNQWNKKRLHDVLHAPKLFANLFSSTKALDRGHTSRCDKKSFHLYDGEKLVAVGARQGNMFQMLIKVIVPDHDKSMVNVVTQNNALRVWHERLGHQNLAHVRKFLKTNGIDFNDENFDCDGCAFGKLHRLSFGLREEKSTKCGEIIHADLVGAIETESFAGSKYFIMFKDDYSHFRFVFFLKQKSEVPDKFKIVLKIAEKQFGHPVKCLQTDHGTEIDNETIRNITTENGIQHRFSIKYTPEQNGCAERENRTVMESARSMIHAKQMNPKIWAEAVHTAVYVLNRTGTSTVKGSTPYELWYGKRAQVDHFRIFGSEVYVHIPKQKRKKLDPKAKKCIFVGYDDDHKGFRVMDECNRIFVARDVKFLAEESSTVTIITEEDSDSSDDVIDSGGGSQQQQQQNQQQPARIRKRRTTTLQDIDENNILDARLRGRSQSQSTVMAMSMMAINDEPRTYQEAIDSSESQNWKNAMESEYDSLIRNHTWILVQKPENQRVIDNKWVFKVKKNPDDTIDRYKARLVCRGFNQEYGIDYMETFAPVVRFDSLRAILAIVAEKRMHMLQFDVKTAFLNGELEENVFMRQPVGFDDNSGRVCKLQKSLYGLKQASRCWNQKFKSFAEHFGFDACESDPCVFASHKNGSTLILTIYVDDGFVVGTDKASMELVIEHLQREFEIRVMDVNCFLGFEIDQRDDGSIFMHQTAYANRILQKFQMENCVPVCVPSDPNQVLCKFDDSGMSDYPYRHLVGSLMYLAIATRPDISYAIGNVSRYMENPTVAHERALKRILKYIAGTKNHGILFKHNGNHQLHGFSDADYAGDVDSRKSTSGYVFLFNDSTISWRSSLQKCVSISTTESEYVSASEAVKEMVWLKRLYEELAPNQQTETCFYMDNMSAIRLVKNPEFHRRTKHIDVRYHFIREKFNDGLFKLEHVSTDEMIADIFTKALPKIRFEYLRTMMGITPRKI